ncbi:hypothetical protein Tco_0490714 [Tanacetum coccineum]
MFIKSRIYLDDEYVVMTRSYFLQYTQLKIPEFHDTLIQLMESVKSIDERAQHKKEYDSWMNERQISGNDAHADDAYIILIYDKEPMAEVPTGKIFTSSTTKVDSEPTNGSNEDITNQYECEQTLDVSAGTLNLSAVMTSDHNSSELKIHDHNNELSSSKLVPKVVPPADKTATSRQELELLFHHHITMLRSTYVLVMRTSKHGDQMRTLRGSKALSWKPCQGGTNDGVAASFQRKKVWIPLPHISSLSSAPPEGENSAKRQKTSEYEAYVTGESSGQDKESEQSPSSSGNQEQVDDYDFWTESYASDDDEILTKQVSQDIMEEVSLTINEAELKKIADEMLRQRCC